MPARVLSTPLLAPGSPLDKKSRTLIQELYDREQSEALALPTDDPLDPKRRRRVDFTRDEIFQQPDAIRETLETERTAIIKAAREIATREIKRVYLVGCGDTLAV